MAAGDEDRYISLPPPLAAYRRRDFPATTGTARPQLALPPTPTLAARCALTSYIYQVAFARRGVGATVWSGDFVPKWRGQHGSGGRSPRVVGVRWINPCAPITPPETDTNRSQLGSMAEYEGPLFKSGTLTVWWRSGRGRTPRCTHFSPHAATFWLILPPLTPPLPKPPASSSCAPLPIRTDGPCVVAGWCKPA